MFTGGTGQTFMLGRRKGEKFRWHVDGDTAILTGPPLPAGVSAADVANRSALVLEYRLRRE